MEDKRYLDIAIIRAKESIITRSIEKKLTDEHHHVEVYSDRPEELSHSIQRTEVFIFYLSDDFRTSEGELRNFATTVHSLKLAGKRGIVVTEKDLHMTLIRSIPDLRGFFWLYRPVDMVELMDTVNNPKARETVKERSILIVDDDPTFAKMIREWLKDEYKVSVVTAGMQAITYLMKNDVDLILLDYEMPVVDGPQVLEMLRSEPATELIPVVFLTGVKTKEGVSRAAALKPDGYLLKSTPKKTLLTFLQDFFDKH
ncbi:MAG: response regulator [Lachnospiraceae bacterium]|nr:response regulator [Lachnospiraceae bacterium]